MASFRAGVKNWIAQIMAKLVESDKSSSPAGGGFGENRTQDATFSCEASNTIPDYQLEGLFAAVPADADAGK